MSTSMVLRKSVGDYVSGWHRSRAVRLAWHHLQAFWDWWIGELRPLMPEALRVLILHERLREIIEPEGDGFRISRSGDHDTSSQVLPLDAARLRTSGTAERVLVLPRDRVIARRTVLPLAAEDNLREVLAFEMDRLTPFTADRVYYDARVTERDTAARMLTLELLVAPRCEVDQLLIRLESAELTPDVVTARSDRSSQPLSLNLLTRSGRATWRAASRTNVIVGLILLLLFGVAVSLPLIEKQRRLGELEPQLAQAIEVAAQARDLQSQVNKLVAGSTYLNQKKRQDLSVLATLNALTQILPGHTWVERFEMEGRTMRIQGVSGSAETLIALLERSAGFENVRFVSPVVRHERQAVDRFHISADVEHGVEP